MKEKLWAGDTFVDFDHSLSTAVNKIREALGDSATSPRFNVAMDDAPFVRGLQTLADWCAARALFGDDEAQQGGNSNPSQNPIHRVPFLAPVSAKPRETSIWAPRAA